nr:ribonuclease H-like domain-containing protein [Tanacetum cinerariifolium]
GKEIVNSPQPIYDQEPSMVVEDDETSKDKEIDKLMALISLSFKKIYKPNNNNLRTSSNTSRANQDNSPRINRSTGHVARECQKPKRVKDASYHREKMLLCKQEEAGIQLNAEQADWRDDTDDELEDQELEAHYMYMAKLQEVSPDAADFGPIFDAEPLHKVSNDDHYNVFAIESEHPKQSESAHDTYPIEQDEHNDNSPRINRGAGYDNQRLGNVVGARDTVGTTVVQKSRIQCYNCKEFGHVARECQKPKRVKDAAYHREKMLLCKQEEARIQLNAEQADWRDDTDDESEDQELEAHYMYIAQIQEDKGIVISELKKLINKLKGKSVDTKFEKSSVIRQPNAFKSQRPSILGKPTIFLDSLERKDFSKSKSVTKNNVSNDFLKPVTAQTLPPNTKPVLKNTNVLAPGMYKLHTEPTQTRTSQLPNDSRKTNKRVSFSTRVIPTTSVSRPQLKSNLMEDRVLLNNSQGKKHKVEDHRRNVKFSKNKTSREPKRTVTQSVAKPFRKIVASETTNQKPRNITRKLYERISKACSWWYPKFTPPGYNWQPKSEIGNIVEIVLFIVDFRCSKHMTGNLKLLINFVEKFLGLNHNLFSVSQFCDADLEVAFRKSTCYIRDLKGNDLLTGILYQTSVARTPEQNGVVERRKRTVVEVARTMLSAAKVPLF